MIFHRNDITPERPLLVDEDIAFPKVTKDLYPLLGVKNVHLKGEILKIEGILHLVGELKASLVLSDARSLKRVPYAFQEKVECDLLQNEDEEGDGYVFPENRIDLDEVAACLLLSLYPKSYTVEKSLPKAGDGYEVVEEGQESPLNSPFASLNPDDFD